MLPPPPIIYPHGTLSRRFLLPSERHCTELIKSLSHRETNNTQNRYATISLRINIFIHSFHSSFFFLFKHTHIRIGSVCFYSLISYGMLSQKKRIKFLRCVFYFCTMLTRSTFRSPKRIR